MDEKYTLLINSVGLNYFKIDEPLKYHTYLKIGGPAKVFFIALKQYELIKIITICRKLKVDYLVIGTGSKIAISDVGFNGVVVKSRINKVEVVSVKGKVSRNGIGVEQAVVEAESGLTLSQLAEFLGKQGLENRDFLNTTGSVGGNVPFNRSLQHKVESIKVFNEYNEVEKIKLASLNLKQHVILSVIVRVQAKGVN